MKVELLRGPNGTSDETYTLYQFRNFVSNETMLNILASIDFSKTF